MATSLISRTVKDILRATPQQEGAGVTVKRTIGTRKLDHFDPFLLLDEFNTDNVHPFILQY
jgi:redox-sensitive bicupin YhaK (pirin superfamily)